MALLKDKNKVTPTKEELELKEKFYNLMFELDLFNKFKKTYWLDIKKETNYGYFAHLHLVSGLSFEDIEKEKVIIEQTLKCMWIMEVEPFAEYAKVQIVTNPIDENMEFENPKIKPNELYLGLSFSNKIQKNNNNDICMFLLAGATGSGKTRFIYQILLAWILGCTPEEIHLYISDIAKNEYVQFRNVNHVKYYASELSELAEMMEQIEKEYERRKKLISASREKGLATNIEEYNKINKKNKLAYCYTVIDEFSILLPDKTDSKDDKKVKEYILDTIKKTSKLGRSLGMFILQATQKTTREEIPPILKNMSGVRISFKANDRISSEVIMENSSAWGLPKRIAVFTLDGGTTTKYLYSPKLTMEKLKELLDPHLKTNKPKTNKPVEDNVIPITRQSVKQTTSEGMSHKELLKKRRMERYEKMSVDKNIVVQPPVIQKGDGFIDY